MAAVDGGACRKRMMISNDVGRYFIAAVCVVFGLVGCRNGQRAKRAAAGAFVPARVAEIYFSTAVDGYIEPCGCTSKPLGGLQRLATVIGRGVKHRALIDSGNLLFPKDPLDAVTGEQHRLKSRILSRAYRQLGAAAINLGAADLAAGVDFLAGLQREGALSFVSSNVRLKAEGGPSVAQSSLRDLGGIKIGLTGVAMPDDFRGLSGVTASEYLAAVRVEVGLLRKRGAEIVIVLAHVGDTNARDLARKVPQIDVIVRGPGTPITQPPTAAVRVGNVIVVEAGSQGQHIGRMSLRLGAARAVRPIAFDDGGYAERQRRKLVERKVAALRRQIERWQGDAKKADTVAARKKQLERLEAQLKKSIGATAPSGPSIKVEIIPLTDDLPADPAMSELLAAYYAQLKEMNLAKGDLSRCKKADEAPSFVGTEACQECHEEAYDFWKKTKHAVAWATLEDDGKHFDLTCIGCHTVGYQEPGGFCRLRDVGVLKNVGCENCHGAGSKHVEEEGDTDFITLEAPEETCAGICHVPEHSDTFDYGKYLLEITGEGHELADGSVVR